MCLRVHFLASGAAPHASFSAQLSTGTGKHTVVCQLVAVWRFATRCCAFFRTEIRLLRVSGQRSLSSQVRVALVRLSVAGGRDDPLHFPHACIIAVAAGNRHTAELTQHGGLHTRPPGGGEEEDAGRGMTVELVQVFLGLLLCRCGYSVLLGEQERRRLPDDDAWLVSTFLFTFL